VPEGRPWEDEALRHRPGQAVHHAWGEADGVLSLDGSDLLHQGQASVGVKGQACGAGGQADVAHRKPRIALHN